MNDSSDTVASASPSIPSEDSAQQPSNQDYQDWFLLSRIAEVQGQLLTLGKIKAKVKPNRVKNHLSLDQSGAEVRLQQLASQGLLTSEKKGSSVSYALSEQGQTRLRTLKPHPEFVNKDQALLKAVPDHMRRHISAFLLLQLLDDEQATRRKGDLNKSIKDPAPKDMELTTALANAFRKHLAEKGYLQLGKDGRAETYHLTEDGREELAKLEHYPGAAPFKVSGRALNALVEIIRESNRRLGEPATVPPPTALPSDLKQAALDEFGELLRTKHSSTKWVPIHEIRQRLREKYGEEVTRHDLLDEAIRQLRRDGQVRLIPLSDLQRATPEQLDDSIPNVDETLFYVEAVHEQSVAQ